MLLASSAAITAVGAYLAYTHRETLANLAGVASPVGGADEEVATSRLLAANAPLSDGTAKAGVAPTTARDADSSDDDSSDEESSEDDSSEEKTPAPKTKPAVASTPKPASTPSPKPPAKAAPAPTAATLRAGKDLPNAKRLPAPKGK